MDWFCICTSGHTVDGRVIDPEWLRQVAATYSPEVYGARINIEHVYPFWPNSELGGYGDVVAVKAEELEGGVVKLFAQLDPTEKLVKLNKLREKVYTSIELALDFCNTGKAYLMGLAVTDSPASVGTSMLQFSKTVKAAAANNIFITYSEENQDMSTALQALFKIFTKTDSNVQAEAGAVEVSGELSLSPEAPAALNFSKEQSEYISQIAANTAKLVGDEAAKVIEALGKSNEEAFTKLQETIDTQAKELTELKAAFAKIPATEQREDHGGETRPQIDY